MLLGRGGWGWLIWAECWLVWCGLAFWIFVMPYAVYVCYVHFFSFLCPLRAADSLYCIVYCCFSLYLLRIAGSLYRAVLCCSLSSSSSYYRCQPTVQAPSHFLTSLMLAGLTLLNRKGIESALCSPAMARARHS